MNKDVQFWACLRLIYTQRLVSGTTIFKSAEKNNFPIKRKMTGKEGNPLYNLPLEPFWMAVV